MGIESSSGRQYGEFIRPGATDWRGSELEYLIPVELPMAEIIELAENRGSIVSLPFDKETPTRIITITRVEEKPDIAIPILQVMAADEVDGRESVWIKKNNIRALQDVCQGLPNEHLDNPLPGFFRISSINPTLSNSWIQEVTKAWKKFFSA